MSKSTDRTLLVNVMTVLIATLCALVIAEVILRRLDGGASNAQHLDYRDTWRKGGTGPGGYLQENFSDYVQDGFGGRVLWTNNSMGFRSTREFTTPAPDNTFRVLSMGDSFVGGYRVGQEQTFSYLLEKKLSEKYGLINVELMVSVIEDPLTGLKWMKKKGLSYEPNLVLLGITLGNDLTQIHAARQKWSGELKKRRIPAECLTERDVENPRDGPRWKKISNDDNASRSRLHLTKRLQQLMDRKDPSRPQTVISDSEEYNHPKLFESNGLGIFLESPPQAVEEAYGELFETLRGLKALSGTGSFELLVVLFPQRFQVQPQDWEATLEIYGLIPSCFDLAAPSRRILDFCRDLQLECVDPTHQMRKAYAISNKSEYLPNHDMHWNSLGHEIVAESLLSTLEDRLVDIYKEIPARRVE